MPRAACAACLAVLITSAAAGAQGLPQSIEDAINKVVTQGAAPDFTRCKLQDALWGRYDVRVFITQGVNALPYRFELRSGRFSYGIDPDPDPGTPPHFERDGRLLFNTPSDAFARGLPFLIQTVSLSSPNQLKVTVLSNPAASVEDAMVLAIIDDSADSVDLPMQTAVVSSSKEPQTITLTDEALTRARGVRLAVLKGADRRALAVGCLISNEIDADPRSFR